MRLDSVFRLLLLVAVTACAPGAGPNEEIVHLNSENFEEEVLRSDLPVLVDFWAPWCGPCKTIGPLIDALASEYSGRIKVAKAFIKARRR